MAFEFRVSKATRIFALFLALLAYSCAPAPAETHGWGNPHIYYEDEEYGSFFSVEPIQIPKVTTEDVYKVAPSPTQENPLNRPLSLTIVDRAPDHYADVVFYNVLAPTMRTHAQVDFVRKDGNVITVIFDMADGDDPDLFMVLPPPGYVAIPAEMSVNENDSGTIEIHELTLG